MKICTKCNQEKSLSDFNKPSSRHCKMCNELSSIYNKTIRIKEYRDSHKEKLFLYQKDYRESNKNKKKIYMQSYQKEWYLKNKDKKLEQNKYYLKHNPDVAHKAYLKYVNKPWNKEKRNLKTKEWRLNNPEKDRIKCQKRRAARKNAYDDWSITVEAINQMLIDQNWLCNICKCDLSKWFDRDHIIPLSKWWHHALNNIQLLCWFCNWSKWDRILIDNKL